MDEETDEALIYYISQKESDPGVAREAWRAFYVRHRDFVYRSLLKLAKGHPAIRTEDVEEAVVDVFRKVFQTRDGQCNLEGIPLDRQPFAVKAWLAKIASNSFHDRERASFTGEVRVRNVSENAWVSMGRSRVDHSATSVGGQGEDSDDSTPSDGDVRLMSQVLDQLPQRDRDVLLLWAEKYDAETGKKVKLSSTELQVWCERLGTTSEGLRQRQKRALAEVEKLFTEAKERKKRAG